MEFALMILEPGIEKEAKLLGLHHCPIRSDPGGQLFFLATILLETRTMMHRAVSEK
jgi:hypothetical protein